jgi:hypothetical protein
MIRLSIANFLFDGLLLFLYDLHGQVVHDTLLSAHEILSVRRMPETTGMIRIMSDYC